MERNHPWRMRFIVGLTMIILSLVGLISSTLRQDGAWNYWRIMVPIYAGMCIFLSWYLRSKSESLSVVKIWHEILHWAGLLLSVYLVSLFVEQGLIERFGGSLAVLTLLAFALFTAGIYIEISFMLIGGLLGLFSVGAGVIAEYLYTIIVPLGIIAIVVLYFIVRRKKSKPEDTNPHE
ncbi:MAG: hypothetical protein SNF33_06360 [Candidatus Algichlamydia australiensis]|nr:hypothetical protein [Chlamydiales bacterium]